MAASRGYKKNRIKAKMKNGYDKGNEIFVFSPPCRKKFTLG